MLMDIKLSEAQLSQIIHSRRLFDALLGKFAGLLMKVAVPLAKNVVAPLVTMTWGSAIDGAVQIKMPGRSKSRKRNLLSYFEWRYRWY